jgi:sn-glycerol 3-phosphate transport system permease protein
MQVPEELLESARLDEANELQVITKIMLPMAKATIVNIMMLSMMGTWNSYFWPLVMTYHDEIRPITIAIQSMKDMEGGMQWPIIMAGNCILVLPILVLFLAASKKIIAAMAYRGVK